MAKTSNTNAKTGKSNKSGKPAKGAKPETVTVARRVAKAAKPKGPVPASYAKKVKQIIPVSFSDFFEQFKAKQNVLGFDLFTGELGKYAVQIGEKKMVIQSFENEKGVQFECLETDFGFSSRVFLGENLVKGFSSENFAPNYKLPEDVQSEQKNLHSLLRTAYELTDAYKAKLATDTYKVKPLFSLVPKAPQDYNKFASFAREEKTSSNVHQLVLGHVKVYRIADENGKYAVLSMTSEGNVVKVVRITLKFLEAGHQLEGKCPLDTMVELHKLNRESLGKPHGQYEQQQRNQGVLHAWLRKVALAAGIKAKTPQKAEKYGVQKRQTA